MVEKIKVWLVEHKDILQIIKFIGISLIAFAAEYAIFYALQYGLYSTCGQEDFKWFLFEYKGGKEGAFGLAGFIAFLVSKCVAEVISFIINRKKNFEADNNIVFSIVTYVITVVALIIFSTWLGGALYALVGDSLGEFGTTIGKLLGSFISFIVMFLMDKFVIMTKKGDKKNKKEDAVEVTTEEVQTIESNEGGEN